jgi:hypothetical protein
MRLVIVGFSTRPKSQTATPTCHKPTYAALTGLTGCATNACMSDEPNIIPPEAFGVAAWFVLRAILASIPELRAPELFDRVSLALERLQAGEPDDEGVAGFIGTRGGWSRPRLRHTPRLADRKIARWACPRANWRGAGSRRGAPGASPFAAATGLSPPIRVTPAHAYWGADRQSSEPTKRKAKNYCELHEARSRIFSMS